MSVWCMRGAIFQKFTFCWSRAFLKRFFPKQCLHLGVLAELKECWWNIVATARPTGHAKCQKNNEFIIFFKKNGAGVRVLRSVASPFDECLS